MAFCLITRASRRGISTSEVPFFLLSPPPKSRQSEDALQRHIFRQSDGETLTSNQHGIQPVFFHASLMSVAAVLIMPDDDVTCTNTNRVFDQCGSRRGKQRSPCRLMNTSASRLTSGCMLMDAPVLFKARARRTHTTAFEPAGYCSSQRDKAQSRRRRCFGRYSKRLISIQVSLVEWHERLKSAHCDRCCAPAEHGNAAEGENAD